MRCVETYLISLVASKNSEFALWMLKLEIHTRPIIIQPGVYLGVGAGMCLYRHGPYDGAERDPVQLQNALKRNIKQPAFRLDDIWTKHSHGKLSKLNMNPHTNYILAWFWTVPCDHFWEMFTLTIAWMNASSWITLCTVICLFVMNSITR